MTTPEHPPAVSRYPPPNSCIIVISQDREGAGVLIRALADFVQEGEGVEDGAV